MSSPYAEKLVARMRATLSKWTGGFAEVWEHQRAHQGIVVRLANESWPGCLLLYFGDVARYSGPLRWYTSNLTLRTETDPRTGDDVYVATDDSVGLEVICAVVEAREMREERPD